MDDPWYKDGIHFECAWPECATCCQGWLSDDSVFVVATKEELEQAAAQLEIPVEEFNKLYSSYGRGIKSKDSKCVMYTEDGKCRIYPSRPRTCRAFPFVPERIYSKAAFESIALRCLGIGKGKLFTVDEIEALRDSCLNH